jgi:hypothetical protein
MLRKAFAFALLVAALSMNANLVGPNVPHRKRETLFAGVSAIGLIGLIGLAVRKSRRAKASSDSE